MNIERLNINVRGSPVVGFLGGDEAINELASSVGEKIPEAYKSFLRFADGGHPEVGCFYLHGSDVNNGFDVDWFYSVANPAVELVKNVLKNWGGILGDGMLPIGCDGGGNLIYLDLSSDASSVWLYLHDEDKKRLKVADSFEQFIDGLTVNPDFI